MTTFTTAESGISAIYVGYFGRAGDPSGMRYWTNQMQAGVMTISQIAASFSVQVEAVKRYSWLANDRHDPGSVEEFINGVYQDLLRRNADPGGLAYWTAQLQARAGDPQAIGRFILDLISGASGHDDATITNKVVVANYFTSQFANSRLTWDSKVSAEAAAAVTNATSDFSSVKNVEAAVDSYISHRLSTLAP